MPKLLILRLISVNASGHFVFNYLICLQLKTPRIHTTVSFFVPPISFLRDSHFNIWLISVMLINKLLDWIKKRKLLLKGFSVRFIINKRVFSFWFDTSHLNLAIHSFVIIFTIVITFTRWLLGLFNCLSFLDLAVTVKIKLNWFRWFSYLLISIYLTFKKSSMTFFLNWIWTVVRNRTSNFNLPNTPLHISV